MFLLALAAAALPPVLTVVLFSQLSPVAPSAIHYLATLHLVFGLTYGTICFISTATLVLILWLIGWAEWEWHGRKWIAWWMVFCGVMITSVAMMPHFPAMSAAVLTLLAAALLLALRGLGYPDEHPASWYSKTGWALLCTALVILIAWVVWIISKVSEGQQWTSWEDSFRAMVRNSQITWKMAFVAWLMPLAVAVELLIMCILCRMRKRQVEIFNKPGGVDLETVNLRRSSGDGMSLDQIYLVNQVKHLGLGMMCAVLILWITASIGSTGAIEYGQKRENLRDEVLGVAFWAFVAVGAWMIHTLGPAEVKMAAEQSKVAAQIRDALKSDWAKACGFILIAPLFPLYLLLDLLRSPARKIMVNDEKAQRQTGWYGTRHVDGILESIANWKWTSVLFKAHLIGIAYVVLEVGCMKATTVLLAYTNEVLSHWSIYSVCFWIFLIGTFLFLLPPTPGPPVYMVCGIVVTASGMSSGMTFAESVAIATAVGYAMKMVFTLVAQVCIGVPLASSVSVRRLVGVNTIEIRAIEQIISEPTFTLPKMFILIGGPDWPVAVLAGILRLSVCQIMLGISPVLFQSVFPCVYSGALLYVAGEDSTAKSMVETSLAVAGILQVVSLLLAGYYVQELIEKDYEELKKPRAQDEDIIRLDQEAAAAARVYERETEWNALPFLAKSLLVLGVACLEISIILLAGPWEPLLGVTCFKPFSLMSSVDKDLNGDPMSIVNPLGWVALSFFMTSVLTLTTFYFWAQSRVGNLNSHAEGKPLLDP